MRYYYKILYKTGDRLASLSAMDKCRLTYSTDYWTKPECKKSKLFVFKQLKDAILYDEGWVDTVIYRCEVKNPEKCNKPISKFVSAASIYDYWHHYRDPDLIAIAPEGTYLCDKVKLISVAYEKEEW